MILFQIKIEEENGGVHFHCETPPSVATPQEVEAGLSFKRMFAAFCGGKMDRDWKSPNNEIGEEN